MAKTALVLEGGGLRGIYTAGVLDCFMDEGITFPYIIGTSAGACNATAYLSGQRGRQYKLDTELLDKRYCGVGQLMKNGSYLNMNYLFNEVPDELLPFDYDAFFENPATFISTCTNCVTGECEYFPKDRESDPRMDAVKASSSLPIVAPMVPLGDGAYLDGGLVDPIPYQKPLDDGCDNLVVVLTRPEGYTKKKEKGGYLLKRLYDEYPEVIKAVKNRPNVYNAQVKAVDKLEGESKALIIRPSKSIKVGRIKAKREVLDSLYQLGYDDAKANAAAVKSYLEGVKL